MGMPKIEKLNACEMLKYIYAHKEALSPLSGVSK
jgi:hypothetical protein